VQERGEADLATVLDGMTTAHSNTRPKECARWVYTSMEGPSVSEGIKFAVYQS